MSVFIPSVRHSIKKAMMETERWEILLDGLMGQKSGIREHIKPV